MRPAFLQNHLVALQASALQDEIQTELKDRPFGRRRVLLEERGRGVRLVQRWMGNEEVCFNEIGMHPNNFRRLSRTLQDIRSVGSTRRLPRDLRLAMTLYMLRKSATYRTVQEHFQVSMRSLSLCLNEVIDALFDKRFYNRYVRQPTPQTVNLSLDQYTNPKTAMITCNCLGALDGTHIPAFPPSAEAGPYRGYKGELTFNVLAAVTFDGLFCYVYAGWEGSANDARVLNAALDEDFRIPPGWFYLADAGYPLSEQLLVPYKGVIYHLRERLRSSQRPQNAQENFNLRHAQARNVVERAFGRLKKKFRVLVTGTCFPLETQIKLIYACCAVMNFMMLNGEPVEDEDDWSSSPGLLRQA